MAMFLAICGSLIAVDQLVKLWARHAGEGIPGRTLLPLWPGVFELKLVFNEGVAFGMFQGSALYMAPIAVLIAIGAGWYVYRHPKEGTLIHIALAVLSAGAVGNLIDRVWRGRVTDMFWIRLIDFPVFNVADIWITSAAALLMLGWLRDGSKKSETGGSHAQ